MVKLHSCASLVNAPALCAMEHEVKGESSVNIIAQISAELQREKQKNAELMQRISTLEAQIRERDKVPLVFNGQGGCQNTVENKSKRQKVGKGECEYIRVDSQMKHYNQWMPDTHMYMKDRVVTWMGMDETDFLQSEFLRGSDPAADFEDMDDTDDENGEEDDINGFLANHKNKENNEEATCKKVKEDLLKLKVDREADTQNLASSSRGQGELTSSAHADKEIHESLIGKRLNPSINPGDSSRECNHHQKEETAVTGAGHECASNTCNPQLEIKRCENMFQQKKIPKIAFCPKEVKRIIQSDELSRKNAQSHTIRKIIVFASLGVRHGCEDMYELDFNHFSILHKGQPYLSPKDPGEHVLYENPGFRRKIFYPNRQNPTLCPVQILEEEKAMRPSDAGCPSCLFLCIKYGGRTRNIPQNEYVRQQMGRNKLKSFGPAICRMSMLVHIRSGSFFFKALGITLLFMAGYPDDIVQRETKYRNLDLLQKYYRTDEDAEGEELFLSYPVTSDTNDNLISPRLSMKTISTKSKCMKNTGSTCQGTKDKTSVWPPAPSNSGDSSQFELKGYASVQNQAITTAQCIPSQAPAELFSLANPLMSSTNANFPHYNQSYPMFPPHPNNSFVPMMYWHPSPMFLHYPHPSSHSFMYPIAGNFVSVYPQPNHGTPTLIPKPLKDSLKNDVALSENANCESNTSSSSTEPNKDQTS